MKNFKPVIILVVCMGVAVLSTSGLSQTDINLIDTPTSNVLGKGEYYVNFCFYQQGGLLIKSSAGLTEKLTIGASYGGIGVVGTNPIKGNPEPAFSLKYKLGEEGENLPFAISAGYEGQGYGIYYREGETIQWEDEKVKLTRSFYQINSKGFYVALSKKIENSNLTIHGGINHCLENDPGKAGVSLFMGTEFEVTPKFAIKVEYNNGFHDRIKPGDVFQDPPPGLKPLRKAGGEINLGLKLKYSPQLILEIDFKDLSGRYTQTGNRTFQIIYSGEF